MIALVDTSVWIDHFRRGNDELGAWLERGEVWCHRFVIGELACGNLRRRGEILSLLAALPAAPVARQREVLGFVELHRLAGRGLGWIDAHLLASARLANIPLRTLDRQLGKAARELGCLAERKGR